MDKLATGRTEYHRQWRAQNKEHLRQYRANNADKILQQQRARHAENPEKRAQDWQKWYRKNKVRSCNRRFTEAKHTAKKRDIVWLLTLQEYEQLISLPCYYCDNQLGEPVKRSIGLDRLNSNKGYQTDNVVSCCYVCNTIKHVHLSPEEMKLVAITLIQFRASQLPKIEDKTE